MPSTTPILWAMIAAIVLLQGTASGEIYFAPRHVIDPARPQSEGEADVSQPFVYLEPHDCCYNLNGPVKVTIYAVNRSGKPVQVDWRAIVGALSLEAVGPGTTTPSRARPQPDSREVRMQGFTSMTFDLKDYFEVKEASVYRLSYTRPLKDGRLHVAGPVTFLVEDATAIQKLAGVIDAGPVRDLVAELLKGNPHFATGVGLKTGEDTQLWDEPEMRSIRWSGNVAVKIRLWEDGIQQLAVRDAPPVNIRGLELLIDRLLFLSDSFRVPFGDRAYYRLTRPINENLNADERERIYLRLARSRDAWVVSMSIGGLMSVESIDRNLEPLTESVPAVDVLISIADGPNVDLAEEAISSLGNYRPDPRITQFLRRKMTDSKRELALKAAIITCYSGDWSGFPLLLRCTRSEDPDLRWSAIAQLGDSRFWRHSDEVVPLLLAELKQPLSDHHLEWAVKSLDGYPSTEVVEAVTPLLEHRSQNVRRRARLTLDLLQRRAK